MEEIHSKIDSNIKDADNFYFYNTIYKFQFNIDTVWKVLRDVFTTNQINSDITSDTKMIKGPNSYTKGSEFFLKYYKLISVYFKVLRIIDEPNYKKLIWKVTKSEPLNVNYYYIYELYEDKINDFTMIKWEIIYEKKYKFYIEQNNQGYENKLKSELNRILLKINKHIEDNFSECINQESIIINARNDQVFDIILNINKLCRIIPDIADKVEYNEEKLKENSKFKFYFREKIFYMKVNKIFELDRESVLEYECITSNKTYLTPNQIIEWKVLLLFEDKCMVSIKHKFNEKMIKKKLREFSNKKIIILKKLKTFIESQPICLIIENSSLSEDIISNNVNHQERDLNIDL